MEKGLSELLTELLKKGQFTTPTERELIELLEKRLLESNK